MLFSFIRSSGGMIQALHNENVKRRKISMKKIGFIDNFLSEWHANNYLDMIRNNPHAKELGFDVCYHLIFSVKIAIIRTKKTNSNYLI